MEHAFAKLDGEERYVLYLYVKMNVHITVNVHRQVVSVLKVGEEKNAISEFL
jgi:hypothetical protein